MTAYDPLHGPDDALPAPAHLDVEVVMAHQLLAEVAPVNIHDDDAVLRAASGLFYRLRSLLAAIDADRGAS